MEQRRAGRSGLALSVLGLGTRTWGRQTDADEAAASLGAFRDAGGTFVDTAGHYAQGRAEAILGSLLQGDRDAITLATRAAETATGAAPAARTTLLAGLTDSLRRLRCEHVDLWQVPAADPDIDFDETLAALDDAVRSGKVRYAGACEPSGWRLARAATWQRAWPGRTPIVTDQVPYSLLERRIEAEVLPAAAGLGVGIVCAATLAGGLLAGRSRDPAAGLALDARTSGIVEAVATAADGLATSPFDLSLSWVRGRPGVTSMIVGARTAAQVVSAVQALELDIPPTIRAVLDEVSAPLGSDSTAGRP